MRVAHDMAFGCSVGTAGSQFRLWAPGARAVDLHLQTEAGVVELPMDATQGGWFVRGPERVGAGGRYGFRIDAGLLVPDPASRYNPDDVHGLSEIVDPCAFDWQDTQWRGRPWHEAVIYELHVGAFTPQGTFAGVEQRLDHLRSLGVTAIELMPVADFPGARNWGYDGVLPYAPDASYGRPEDLKRLVQAAHERGLMIFLDVVYNHFGPDGNYLHAYAPQFFTERHQTPWGAAINFDGDHSRTVRDFFVHNALYWLEEYRFDGLRFDAVHAIADDSSPDIVEEIAQAVRGAFAKDRHVHLVLENDDNAARYLGPGRGYDAQWNDDIHHVLHVLLTGEVDGYYADYSENPRAQLGRCLSEGFAYQGDRSAYRDGRARGEPSAELPAQCFVSFLQNHDQVGNRAFGERLTELAAPDALRAGMAIELLAPQPPLLFMGEEWATRRRFAFFCDFSGALADAVRNGRREEFSRFERFSSAQARAQIPDPCAQATFEHARLDWHEPEDADHRDWLAFTRALLRLRNAHLLPRLRGMRGTTAHYQCFGRHVLRVAWTLGDASKLTLVTNLSAVPEPAPLLALKPLYALPRLPAGELHDAWSVVWYLEAASG